MSCCGGGSDGERPTDTDETDYGKWKSISIKMFMDSIRCCLQLLLLNCTDK